MRTIDRQSRRIVIILRQAQIQDASGNYGIAAETILHSEVIADIQPVAGNTKLTASGTEPASTHIMFTEERFTDLAEHDVIRDGSDDFEILTISDFQDHNEVLLRKL